jgi:hypothetical protein
MIASRKKPRSDDEKNITTPYKMMKQVLQAEVYLNILINLQEVIDSNTSVPEIDSICNLEDSVKYTLNKIYIFNDINSLPDRVISITTDKYYMCLQSLKEYNLNQNLNQCIVLATLLSSFLQYDIDIKKFLNVHDEQIKLISKMLYYINNDAMKVASWMLIPKYILILSKLYPVGIINFTETIRSDRLYDEIKLFINITKKYKYNFKNKYITDVFRKNMVLINNVDKINNTFITIEDIRAELF